MWQILRGALQKLGKTVKLYTMNPKAMHRTQLLGKIDLDTREWSDGVLTNSAREVVKEPLVIVWNHLWDYHTVIKEHQQQQQNASTVLLIIGTG